MFIITVLIIALL